MIDGPVGRSKRNRGIPVDQTGGSSKGMVVDELNHELLVAVLALLTDAIPRPALTAALNAWSRDREQSLAEFLMREGCLDRERLHALECLASSHLRQHDNNLRFCLDAWNAQGLTQEVLTEIGDDSLMSTLGITMIRPTTLPLDQTTPEGAETQPMDGASASPGSAEPPRFTQGERFLPIRPHAKGGIGQVWVARDCELQREVALKVIQPRFAEREDQRRAVPAGGGDHGQPGASGNRPGLQSGSERGGTAVLCDAVHPGGESLVGDPGVPPEMPTGGWGSRTVDVGDRIPTVARPVPRRLRRDRLRAQPWRVASGPEAGEHHAGPLRGDPGRRLGPGQGDRQGRHHPGTGRRGISSRALRRRRGLGPCPATHCREPRSARRLT